jgi:hypothetical protein
MTAQNIQSLIVEFGTDAANLYQNMSRENADAMPEVFLGGFIAQKLYERLACPVHIERLYEEMAEQLGISKTAELVKIIGGQRADVAIYQGQVPSHIVEFKKFAERNPVSSIGKDLEKAKKLASLRPISTLLGILICQTTKELKSRIDELEHELESKLIVGKTQKSANKNWEWCFGCCAYTPN